MALQLSRAMPLDSSSVRSADRPSNPEASNAQGNDFHRILREKSNEPNDKPQETKSPDNNSDKRLSEKPGGTSNSDSGSVQETRSSNSSGDRSPLVPKKSQPSDKKSSGSNDTGVAVAAVPTPVNLEPKNPLPWSFGFPTFSMWAGYASAANIPSDRQPAESASSATGILNGTASAPVSLVADSDSSAKAKQDIARAPQTAGVPLSAYPISIAPEIQHQVNQDASLVASATPVNNSNTQSTATDALPAGAIALDRSSAPEAMPPALSANTLAFSMKVKSSDLEPAKAQAPGAAQIDALDERDNAPSLAALQTVAAAPPVLTSQDSSSGSTSDTTKDAQHGSDQDLTSAGPQNFTAATASPGFAHHETSPAVHAATSDQTAGPVEGAANAGGRENEAVRNMVLQLRNQDNQRVDVRLFDRGGELQVSVRSADTDLAQRLQEQIPELTARLDTQRFTSEVYFPKIENSRAETNDARHFGGSADNSSFQQRSASDDARRQGGQQGRPDWIDLLNSQA